MVLSIKYTKHRIGQQLRDNPLLTHATNIYCLFLPWRDIDYMCNQVLLRLLQSLHQSLRNTRKAEVRLSYKSHRLEVSFESEADVCIPWAKEMG
jgi:hypothetical protein